MDPITIVERLKEAGIALVLEGDRLFLEPGSRVPPDLLAEVRTHKPEIIALLRQPLASPSQVAEAVDESLRLGQKLATGAISAVRCGLMGALCSDCHGMPCVGSTT